MYCNFSEAVNYSLSPHPPHPLPYSLFPLLTYIYSYLLLFNLIVKVKISQIKQEKNLNHLNLKMVPMLIHNCLKATVVLEIIHIFFLKTQNKFLIYYAMLVILINAIYFFFSCDLCNNLLYL